MYKLFITIIFIAILGQPIGASAASHAGTRADDVPVVFDAFLMRPPGLVATVAGLVVFTVGVFVPPFFFWWRTPDMHKPFKSLVINPFRFTFVDPLGYHPSRVESNRAGEIR